MFNVNEDIIANSISWIFQFQNRNGSWSSEISFSKNIEEKVTYSCQAINLLLELGVDENNPKIEKTIRWLNDNVKHNTKYRFSRTEAMLLTNRITPTLKEDLKHFKIYVEEFIKNPNINPEVQLFWQIIPVFIAILKRKETIKIDGFYFQEVLDLVFEKYINSYDDCISVLNKANHSGLFALFLSEYDSSKYESEIKSLLNWILQSHNTINNSQVYWDSSIGVTSYVIIDINRLYKKFNTNKFNGIIEPALDFIKPNKNGFVKADTTATFDTNLHEKELYTTILVSRAFCSHLLLHGNLRSLYEKVFEEQRIKFGSRIKLKLLRIKHILPSILLIVLILTSILLENRFPKYSSWFQNSFFLFLGILIGNIKIINDK